MAMRKILVADDSLTIQKVIRLALSQEGYEIETLGDGNSLLQRLPVFRPDIVLIDISLPGKSAFDARRDSLKNADLANTRWVLMSSAFDQVNDQQVQELKFHGRLIKPFDPTYLRKVLLEASSNPLTASNPPGPPGTPPRARSCSAHS
jgi:CheY-like chemotaxis protein